MPGCLYDFLHSPSSSPRVLLRRCHKLCIWAACYLKNNLCISPHRLINLLSARRNIPTIMLISCEKPFIYWLVTPGGEFRTDDSLSFCTLSLKSGCEQSANLFVFLPGCCVTSPLEGFYQWGLLQNCEGSSASPKMSKRSGHGLLCVHFIGSIYDRARSSVF